MTFSTTSGMTEQQAIDKIAATFNHNVQKFPVKGPDNMETNFYGLFDKDGNIVGRASVTEDYYVHTCDDIIALATAAIQSFNGVMDISCTFDAGHRLIITPPDDFRIDVFGTADNVFGRLMIYAPYVSGSVNVSAGHWRDLCRNLSILEMVHGVRTKIRHTKSLTDRMAELKSEMGNLAHNWQHYKDNVQRMEDNRMQLNAFLTEMYGPLTDDMDKREKKRHIDRTREITLRLLDEHRRAGRPAFASDNFEVTGWEAYNAVQGWRQHQSKRAIGTTDEERQWKAIGDDDIVKAEKLALLGV